MLKVPLNGPLGPNRGIAGFQSARARGCAWVRVRVRARARARERMSAGDVDGLAKRAAWPAVTLVADVQLVSNWDPPDAHDDFQGPIRDRS